MSHEQYSSERRVPTLPAEVLPNGKQLRVWCSHCGRYHLHGRPEPGDTLHRAAHCVYGNLDSPYRDGGYRLLEVGPVGTLEAPRRERAARAGR